MFVEHVGLQFGAVAAVLNFNRVGAALGELLERDLFLAVNPYFDDYTKIEPKASAPGSTEAITAAFDLLGWHSEVKAMDKPNFQSLGVVQDVSRVMSCGRMIVSNSDSWVAECDSLVLSAWLRKWLPPALAGTLRGKLGFANSNTFGACGKVVLKALSMRQYGARSMCRTTAQLELAFEWLHAFLHQAPPRTISFARSSGQPVLIFSDGWQSGDVPPKLGMAAVLWDRASDTKEYFSWMIEAEVVDAWSKDGLKKALINEAEHFPILISRTTWSVLPQGRKVIHFVDNNGARDSHISGYSRSEAVGHILAATKLVEAKIGMWCWFDRVPTDSNIADGPSRDAHELVVACGFRRRERTFPEGWSPEDGVLPGLGLKWHLGVQAP